MQNPTMANQGETAMNLPSDMANSEKELTFKTRFGDVTIHQDRLIAFPHGLFGFRECTQFGLAKLPNVDESPILLMQCINEPSIAFLVADPSVLGLEIKTSDKTEALDVTKLDTKETQFLSILTLYDNGDSYYLTANLKAPVLVDTSKKVGLQYILSSKDYSTQHKI